MRKSIIQHQHVGTILSSLKGPIGAFSRADHRSGLADLNILSLSLMEELRHADTTGRETSIGFLHNCIVFSL